MVASAGTTPIPVNTLPDNRGLLFDELLSDLPESTSKTPSVSKCCLSLRLDELLMLMSGVQHLYVTPSQTVPHSITSGLYPLLFWLLSSAIPFDCESLASREKFLAFGLPIVCCFTTIFLDEFSAIGIHLPPCLTIITYQYCVSSRLTSSMNRC